MPNRSITHDITYYKNGGEFVAGYDAPSEYTQGVGVALPTAADIHKEGDPCDFGGWYQTEGFSGDPITIISPSATSDYVLYAKWIRYTPDASGQPGEIDILTSGIYPYEYDGHTPVRVLFGVKQTRGAVAKPVGTIEVRDANTGEFLYDYTTMQQITVDNAIISRLQIGNYMISPHTSVYPLAEGENDSLLIEYMGE